uniref:Receptor activity modifying protein 2 n=1 Tax=Pyxicephalus adspersus TaxID=30357 RepID=A0AAV3AJI3_PYXAD|nr:TPA: hypothetical protein GDO54_008376 [Pyxicephalus adspersus]
MSDFVYFISKVGGYVLGREGCCGGSRFYSDLQECLEGYADHLLVGYPNDLAHDAILNAHIKFFTNCAMSEEFIDPPENVLLALIFTPICIIPFLVTLVVYKSNTSKPQT